MNSQQKKDASPAPSNHHLWLAVGNTEMKEDKVGVVPADLVLHTEIIFGLEPGIMSLKTRGTVEMTDIKHMLRVMLKRRFPTMIVKKIGELTCHAHHSTVLNSFEKHRDNMAYNKEYRRVFAAYEKEMVGKGLVDA